MILFFHAAYFVLKFFIKNYKRIHILKEKAKLEALQSSADLNLTIKSDAESNLLFDPPVYRQRYSAVQQILLDYRWKNCIKKVVDFGCAEFGLFMYLKNLLSVEEVIMVDILEDLLREKSFRIRPLTADYLKRRANPLTVEVFTGSVSLPDANLLNTDAVIAIELIEHLYPDTLDALPFNIFAFIQPKIAIFTTPNSDFNVLFPNFKKFRHYDHKFEWSREQFESWALNITYRFPQYSVYFEGIGYGPPGTEHLGACSQMAVFVKSSLAYLGFNQIQSEESSYHQREYYPSYESYGVCIYQSYSIPIHDYEVFPEMASYANDIYEYKHKYYKFIEKVDFPVNEDKRTAEEMLMHELIYSVHLLGRVNGRYYKCDKYRAEIPLLDIVCNQQKFVTNVTEVSVVLQKAGYKIETCVDCITEEEIKCVIYEPEMEKGSSSSYTEESDCLGESEWESVGENDRNWTTTNEQKKDCVVQDTIKKVDNDSLPSHSSSEWNTEEASTASKEISEQNLRDSIYCDSGYLNSQSFKSEPTSESDEDCDIEKRNKSQLEVENSTVEDHLKENASNVKKELDQNFQTKEEPMIVVNDYSLSKSGKIKDFRNSYKKDGNDILLAGGSNLKRKKKSKKGPCDERDQQVNWRDDEHEDVIVEERINVDAHNEERVNVDAHNLIHEFIDQVPDHVVENGDLVNNNRDNEGNNYPNAENNVNAVDNNDNENQNREYVDDQELNQDIENRNGFNVDGQLLPRRNEVEVVVREVEEAEEPVEVEFASREALFDPDSQVDLLEGFFNSENNSDGNSQLLQEAVVVIGITPLDENNGAVLPPQANPFPNWLLHLLNNEEIGSISLHDEPHFYCQGDGIGVHPSIIEVDLDEDSDSSSDESSHSNADDNVTLQTNSNSQSDMMSSLLETDSQSPRGSTSFQNEGSSSSSYVKNEMNSSKTEIKNVKNDSNDRKSNRNARDKIKNADISKPQTREHKKGKLSSNNSATVSSTSCHNDSSEKAGSSSSFDAGLEEGQDEENFEISLSLLSNLILVGTEPASETGESTTVSSAERPRTNSSQSTAWDNDKNKNGEDSNSSDPT